MHLLFSKKWLLIFIILLPSISVATGLPPEHEAKRLLLAVQHSIDNSQWDKAEEQLKKIAELDVPLDAKFHYLNGQVQLQQSEFDLAQKSFEIYVLQAGEEGEFYIPSLKMITEADEKKNAVVIKKEPVNTADLVLEKNKDSYLESLKTLYLTDSSIDALVLRINSILSTHPYQGARIKQKNANKGAKYSINVNGNELQIQEKKYDRDGAPTLLVSKMDMYGVDPFVKFSCDYDRYICWLYHPVSQYDRWILIDRDEKAAEELSDAMARLIRLLQGGK
ncbi:tetratricopeptide repeat protein [Alkalimarinus alittae]|uniref:Tetratricopeptide repeat protein n=1 Tax=Alkalimarinus alittae TaxID=2961619 RepID=A0ABY6N5V5_9ALTE|nr:hypothetical protein [Alkalimarinus alittae]UZE97505.1 hypothetical protein NKI27_07110 [Alkalimarinus alittae]